jgi:hypothetical protein
MPHGTSSGNPTSMELLPVRPDPCKDMPLPFRNLCRGQQVKAPLQAPAG